MKSPMITEHLTTRREVSFRYSDVLAQVIQTLATKKKEKHMRQSKSKALDNYSVSYGADTSGFNSGSASDFIRERAYQLFEMRGRAPGNQLEDWLRAEQEVRAKFGI